MSNSIFNNLLSDLLIAEWNKSVNMKDLSGVFVKELLEYGSETPDNLNCAKHIEIGEFIFIKETKYGLKIKDKDISLSEIMNVVENMTIPSEVKEYFPSLSEEEWSAFTRVVTLILIAMEKDENE